jgi:hypothetical protein
MTAIRKEKKEKIERYLLNLAGEYRVCSELAKRGLLPCLSFGNYKGADIHVVNPQGRGSLRIEVKASQKGRFVTAMYKKYRKKGCKQHPDFWVLCDIKKSGKNDFDEKFFVLSHEEIAKTQEERHRRYCKKYRKKHGQPFDPAKGVDLVGIEDVEQYKDAWAKIKAAMDGTRVACRPIKRGLAH